MQNLALQVSQVDCVVIDQGDLADTGGSQIERHRRAQTAGADDERMRGQQLFLTFDANIVEQDVTRVAQQLVVIHG